MIVEKYRKISSIKETRNKRTEEEYQSEKVKAKIEMKEFRDHDSLAVLEISVKDQRRIQMK